MQIPFKTLKATVPYKTIGYDINTDDVFMQNGIRELQNFIEAPEHREINGLMELLTAYARTPNALDKKMMLPKIEFVETELLQHIETAKKRQSEKQESEAKLKELREQWKKIAEPLIEEIFKKIDDLKLSFNALDAEAVKMRYREGTGVTSVADSLTPEELFKKSGYSDLREALKEVGRLY